MYFDFYFYFFEKTYFEFIFSQILIVTTNPKNKKKGVVNHEAKSSKTSRQIFFRSIKLNQSSTQQQVVQGGLNMILLCHVNNIGFQR